MASDDILWQKVEQIKAQEPATPSAKPTATPANTPTPTPQPKSKKKPVTRKAKGSAVYLSDYHASKPDSTTTDQETKEQEIQRASQIEAIRKVVKRVGKDVAFVRLTPEEKQRLADIVYNYKRQGIKTTENEILRIALNSLLGDYKANGKESVLAQVIAALNA